MALGKEEYSRIRSELSTAPSFLPTFGILLLDLALLGTAGFLLQRGSAAPFAAAQILLAIVFFNSFSILHECGHGSLSRSSWVNTISGLYASTFCFIPYYPWKYIHQKHHAWTGNLERDPVLESMRSWRLRGVPRLVRVCWKTWIPLGALLQHVVYLRYPLVMRREGALTFRKAVQVTISILWIPTVVFVLHRLLPDIVRFANVAPALVLFLVAEELVNIPHHVGAPTFDAKLPIWEQHRATRSCYYPPGVSELLVLNFNFHVEHHLFPTLPWYRLRRARRLIKAELAGEYQEAVGIAWNIVNRHRSLQSIVGQSTLRDRNEAAAALESST